MATSERLNLSNKDSVEAWLISFEARARNQKRVDADATTSEPEKRELTDLFLEAVGTEALTTLKTLIAPLPLVDCKYKQFKEAIERHSTPLSAKEPTKYRGCVERLAACVEHLPVIGRAALVVRRHEPPAHGDEAGRPGRCHRGRLYDHCAGPPGAEVWHGA